MSNLTPNKNSLKITMKLGVFFNVILMNLTFLLTGCKLEEGGLASHTGGASYWQNLPEMVHFAAKQTFKIAKLQNYITDVNETSSSYVPPRHLPLAGK